MDTKDLTDSARVKSLIAELDWCIENGHAGPRTHQALEHAREVIAALASDTAGAPIYQTKLRKSDEWRDCDKGTYEVNASHPNRLDTRIVYAAPVAPAAVAPKAEFEDPRVQAVYNILCGDDDPPLGGDHWEGWVSRRIVDALCAPTTVAADAAAPTNETMKDGEQPSHDAVTREQVIEWGRLAGFESSLTREYNLERLADFAIFARQARAASPQSGEKGGQWIERWHGSEPFRGWSIFAGRERIAFIGGDESLSEAVSEIIEAHNRAAAPQAAPADEAILDAFEQAGMRLDPTLNALYTVRGQHAQLIEGVRALLTQVPTERMSEAEDAARYRWLRANGTDYKHWQLLKRLEADSEFDAYIDAALLATERMRDAEEAAGLIGPAMVEHEFSVSPSSGIEICLHCGISKVAARTNTICDEASIDAARKAEIERSGGQS